MAKISTYASDGSPSLSDKLIGTDVGDSNATKNYTISSILSLANLGSFVPYTGANSTVNLGSQTLKVSSIQPGITANYIETKDLAGNGAGMLLDNNNGRYFFGDYNGIGSGTSIQIDDSINVIELFGVLKLNSYLNVSNGVGTSGQVLISGGISMPPSWGTPSAPTLNAVLTAGNISTLDASIGSLFLKNGSSPTYSKISSSLSNTISIVDSSSNPIFAVSSTQLTFGSFARFDNSLLTSQRTYNLPDNAGTIPLSVNGITPNSTTGDITLPSGSGTAKTVKVSLNSAQILALDTTPIPVLAGVAGKIIIPLRITFRYNYGTTNYSGNIIYLSLTDGSWTSSFSQYTGYLTSSTTFTFASPLSFNTTNNLVGASIAVTTNNPITGGDGTLDIYFTYDIADA